MIRAVPVLFFAVLSALSATGTFAAQEIVVYSARGEQLIKPMFDAYTKETGVKITFVTDKEGALLQRLKAEGENTPADMLITADAGNLWQAEREGLLRPVMSATLNANIPPHLRDRESQWFGLSVRARTIVYNTQRVRPAELSSYEDLADPRWKGRLCLRTSKKVYNQSLVAMMIAEHGAAATERIVRSWIGNLATDVFPDDTTLIEAVAAGQCDVGIVNSYYYGRLIEKNPELPARLFWANQKNKGVHVNISGAGVTRHARHPEAAVRLLEWLSTPKAQSLFADVNLEFPANPRVPPHPAVAAWGGFKQNLIHVENAGALQADAVRLMDRAGYK